MKLLAFCPGTSVANYSPAKGGWHLSTGIRRTIYIALIVSLAAFSGCGGGGSSSDSGPALPARTLTWEAPTSFIDSTPIDPVKDLDRYEIYVKESGSFTDTDSPLAAVSTNTSSFNLANLGSPLTVGPHYYVSLRAVAITGLKSDFSPPVSFSF